MDRVGSIEIDARRDAAKVGAARRTLEEARSRLDSALACMPEIDGDEAMATPTLLLLLIGAVDAKNRLAALEVPPLRECS